MMVQDLTGDVRRARELAAQMTVWLAEDISPMAPAHLTNPTVHVRADLVEWCRSARDMLERIAKLAEDDGDG